MRSSRLCSADFPNPRPGSTRSFSGAIPARIASSVAVRERARYTSPRRSAYSRFSCIVTGVPRMCITIAAAPERATTRRISSERRPFDVVDEVRTARRSPGAATSGWRVSMEIGTGDRSRSASITGRHPAPLGLRGDGSRAGTRRLSADVEHARTLLGEAERLGDRLRWVEEMPAVRERVGGDVDDAHDPRTVSERRRSGGRPTIVRGPVRHVRPQGAVDLPRELGETERLSAELRQGAGGTVPTSRGAGHGARCDRVVGDPRARGPRRPRPRAAPA